MKRWNCLLPATVGAVVFLATVVSAAPVVTVDLPSTYNTLIFRDYNGTSDSNVSYNIAPSQSVSGGQSVWTYNGTGGDPQIRYNDGVGTWPHEAYPWVRVRHVESTTAGGQVQVWENPARGGEGPTFNSSTTYGENTVDPLNPTPNGSGYRIDPFGSAAAGRSFTADYVMMDTYQTIGLGEWDTTGDAQGWTTPNVSGVVVADSLIRGVGSNNGDAQLKNATTFDADLFQYVEIRLASDTEADLFWGPNGAFSGSRRIRFGTGDGAFHTYLLDFSQESTWTGGTMTIRLDPVSGVGQEFALDYIRLRAGAITPEPATMALLGLAACGLGGYVRRRRKAP